MPFNLMSITTNTDLTVFGRFDYLKIANENKTINGTYCGQETGKSVLVTGRYAVISLYTDGSYQYTGYELLFHHVTLSKYGGKVHVMQCYNFLLI